MAALSPRLSSARIFDTWKHRRRLLDGEEFRGMDLGAGGVLSVRGLTRSGANNVVSVPGCLFLSSDLPRDLLFGTACSSH